MWDSTLEHGGFPHSFRESPRRLTGAGPMITNKGEDLIGSYTHLNAGSTTLLAFPLATSQKWEPANTMGSIRLDDWIGRL